MRLINGLDLLNMFTALAKLKEICDRGIERYGKDALVTEADAEEMLRAFGDGKADEEVTN